ncbi:hypothetical protein DFH28DRAFT_935930 [Melampsora americana]|nr:hypothetical protein DFH28DRAFT_935930 [Melampsora americana]
MPRTPKPPAPKQSPYARRLFAHTNGTSNSSCITANSSRSASTSTPTRPTSASGPTETGHASTNRRFGATKSPVGPGEVEPSVERTIKPRSDVYLYYEEPIPHYETEGNEYKQVFRCLHCPVQCCIKGRPNSNLHKHPWAARAPGSIPPDEDPVLAAARKKELRHQLIGAIISKNLPFSIFEGNLMQTALRAICPWFYWPGRMGIKADAEELYRDLEQELIEEISAVPGAISTATDTWTSPDYSHT